MQKNTFKLFRSWFNEAEKKAKKLPNAFCLSTVSKDGKPSARVVLLKDFSENGFTFYTNFNSQKGKEIAENPNVALTFYWKETDKQIRIEGIAEKISSSEADEYFHSRPREYQISAWASEQSEVLDSRKTLFKRYKEFEKKFKGQEIPRPPHWSGYCVNPSRMEFWENRLNRMHERIVFEKENGNWKMGRLYP